MIENLAGPAAYRICPYI